MSNDPITEELKVIVFQIKDEEYALEVDYIQSIERMQPVTRIPSTSPFVTGVMNLRGVITPIINLRKRFGIEEKELDEATRILVISKDQLELGLIVDGANDVIDIPIEKIEPSPEVIGGMETDYIRGVVKLDKRLFTLLNLDKIVQ
ncbi:chemotaxis protein CheW [Halalkalibacter alkaliphilus]|uniref:Chemotaxis protein CheW n=1 Tax=Halalkalibacter alkaliphilus TaxID=2917993 RepID=A0A9X2CTQ6_9BACI|nr:chemotaxis protein CheW [Halalkalibacter alkaliphilus]MCL7748151.1 chemotaxis protein CheW [Halalkalibacter alkaliphilus]